MGFSGLVRVDGGELYCEESGSGSAVVLAHGMGLDLRMWEPQLAALSASHRVIRYDQRGFGHSPPPVAPFFPGDDLNAVLKHFGEPRAHLVGFSMGGRPILQHALLHPAATRSLIFIDGALEGHVWSAEWLERWMAVEAEGRAHGAKAANALWSQHPLFACARERPAVRAALDEMHARDSGWAWLNKSPARALKPPAMNRLGAVRCPTLVLAGERDLPDFLASAETLARGIAGARKELIPGAGHMSTMEEPEQVNALVLAFLQKMDARR